MVVAAAESEPIRTQAATVKSLVVATGLSAEVAALPVTFKADPCSPWTLTVVLIKLSAPPAASPVFDPGSAPSNVHSTAGVTGSTLKSK